MNLRPFIWQVMVPIFCALSCAQDVEKKTLIPRIDGDWWQIAGDPDLGAFTSVEQQPVDFGVWQAVDGTWQLWSCIRHTKCGGNTRLFHRWEGKSLTEQSWRSMGIAMEADTSVGETEGGLQAPFVLHENDKYYLFYGDWQRICLAESDDGKSFSRLKNKKGEPDLFTGPYPQSRDPMVIKMDDFYYCYYCGHQPRESGIKHKGAIFCRFSQDLSHWSEPIMVSAGGIAATKGNWYAGDMECPFVLKLDGFYYLFRNQRYGENNLNTQYRSPHPLDFGVDDDRFLISTLPVAAPEIIEHKGEYYIAALLPSLKGIRMAKLKWVSGK